MTTTNYSPCTTRPLLPILAGVHRHLHPSGNVLYHYIQRRAIVLLSQAPECV